MTDLLTYTPQEFASIVTQIHKIERERVLDALVSDIALLAALHTSVADGESVYWSIVFGLQDDTDEIRGVMAREIIRAALTAAANHLRGRV